MAKDIIDDAESYEIKLRDILLNEKVAKIFAEKQGLNENGVLNVPQRLPYQFWKM